MTLYATTDALKLVLDSTDAGTGTAAQLSDEQLTLALQSATDRVSLYADAQFADPVPGIVTDLTLDLAAWWATTYYLKAKEMGPNNPVQLRYTEAKAVLEAIRKGEISLAGPGAGGSASSDGAASARVINRIPTIFTGDDSNTTVYQGVLQPDVPADMASRRMISYEPGGWN